MKHVAIVIPAYNEGKRIGAVLKQLHSYPVIVVDDCSQDNTSDVALESGATVLRHTINRGAGAATKTGLNYAYEQGYEYVITMDGDGQHAVDDIPTLLNANKNIDVVIGSRLLQRENMPFVRKFLNFGGSVITFILYGIYVKDSQTGFKRFNRRAIERIEIKFDRFEFCSEVLHEIKLHKLSYKEVPVKTIYTDESLQKGQSFKNGFKMIYRMIVRYFVP